MNLMLRHFKYFLGILIFISGLGGALSDPAVAGPATGLYDFSVTGLDGKVVELKRFKEQVALVVNTASRCGYTEQYKDLQKIFDKYKSKGFVVLGFPSNDFGGQEPGSDKDIKKFCELKFRVNFPMFAKGKVLGPTKQPVYKFLTDGNKFNGEIAWNFEKFLVNSHGEVVARFDSAVKPSDPKLIAMIEVLVAAAK